MLPPPIESRKPLLPLRRAAAAAADASDIESQSGPLNIRKSLDPKIQHYLWDKDLMEGGK